LIAESASDFLRAFHAQHPGCTSQAFARGAVRGRTGSSYDLLAECVDGAVLDLGCGDGHLLELLVGRGLPASALIGVDLSPDELALARQRPALAETRLIEGRGQRLPLPENCVDGVLSHLAWMLMDDIGQVVAEVARVLRPGGVFAAVVGGGPKVGDSFELFLDLLTPIVRRQGIRVPRMGDPRCRSEAGLRSLLAPSAGFATLQIEDFAVDLSGSFPQVWRSLSTVYERHALSPVALGQLRATFESAATGMATDGVVPCSMFVRRVLATTS